jgi:hypothetical protein
MRLVKRRKRRRRRRRRRGLLSRRRLEMKVMMKMTWRDRLVTLSATGLMVRHLLVG